MSGLLLSVVSGKGGVGKSFVAAALGARWAREGKSVVVLDMNLGMRYLDMLFGMESRVCYDLADVVASRCGLSAAMVEDRNSGLRLISAPQFLDGAPLNERVLRILLEVLCSQHDIVLMDAPGGMADGFAMTARLAWGTTLLVTTPDDMSLRDAERTAMLLREAGAPAPLLVVNRLREALVDDGLQHSPEVCAQVLDARLLGAIPEDERALRLSLGRDPSLGDTRAAQAIDGLRARLMDDTTPPRPWREAPAAQTPPPVEQATPVAQTPPARGLRAWLRRVFGGKEHA